MNVTYIKSFLEYPWLPSDQTTIHTVMGRLLKVQKFEFIKYLFFCNFKSKSKHFHFLIQFYLHQNPISRNKEKCTGLQDELIELIKIFQIIKIQWGVQFSNEGYFLPVVIDNVSWSIDGWGQSNETADGPNDDQGD